MSAEILDKMVYSFMKPMWHNIVEPNLIPMSAEGILDEKWFGGFEVLTRPLFITLNGVDSESGQYGIVRTPVNGDGEVCLGTCSSRYIPLQPRDIAKSFDDNVGEPAETMAFLSNGKEMFISWQMPSFSVTTADDVEMYGIVRTGFDTLKGARLFTSIYRPVCANTINMAEGWARKNSNGSGKGMIWKGKAVSKNLIRDLGYWMSHVQQSALREGMLLESLFKGFAQKPIKSEAEVTKILENAYPYADNVSGFYPPELRDKKNETIEAYNMGQGELRAGIRQLFNGAGTEITPTYWGMLNSTTEYFCHYQPSKRPPFESAMFGSRQQNMMKMVSVLANG